MELLLNVVWLALAAGALGPALRGGSRRNVLTVACLIAILFPIISITDDLAGGRNPLEEPSRFSVVVIVAAVFILAIAPAAVDRVERETPTAVIQRFALDTDPRSPPRG